MLEPLVLVPGLGCTAALYAPQWMRLGVRRQVLVADHAQDESLADIARRLLAIAPPRFALCGLSMGGYISFEIMRQAPDRVTRLALLDTSAKPPTPETNAMRLEMIAMVGKGAFDKVIGLQWQRLVAPARRDDDVLRATVRGMAEAIGPEAWARQQRAIMGRPDSRPDLPRYALPTLVLVGAEDLITPPAEAREIAAGVPASRLVEIEGCGHLATLEAPEQVTEELERWLAA